MSLYEFIDTVTTDIPNQDLPAEALQINGDYLEDMIDGYRTLHVSGREGLAKKISSYEVGDRDGSTLQSTKYPERVITVTYQLITNSDSEFREAYNVLAGLLSTDESELVFADEPDKFFIGTCTAMEAPDPGSDSVIGTLEFTCNDPFKYSIEEYSVYPTGSDGVFSFMDPFFSEVSSDSGEEAVVDNIISTPTGDYSGYAAGQVLSHTVSDRKVFASGNDAWRFTQGQDYVLDTASHTVYVTSGMLANDIQIDSWVYNTTDDLLGEDTVQFSIPYGGTAPASPELIARFNQGVIDDATGGVKDDACGYVAFIDGEKNIIQIGDPTEEDDSSKVLGATTRYTDWNKKKGTSYWSSSTEYHPATSYSRGSLGYATWKNAHKDGGGKKTETVKVTKTVKGKKKTVSRKKTVYTNPKSVQVYRPKSYGTKPAKDKWYGPTIVSKLPNDDAGNSGAKNFTFTWEQIFASTKDAQHGLFEVDLVNNNGGNRTVIAGVLIRKGTDGANCAIYHTVNGIRINAIDTKVNAQQYNTNFGLSEKLYKKVKEKKKKSKKKYKWVYNGWSKPTRVSTISKKGQTITFDIAGIRHIYRDEGITDTYVNEIWITFGARSGKAALSYNGIQNAKFINATPETTVEIKNTFSVGDEMVADCKDGEVTLNGIDKTSLGALGNDWEGFTLKPGDNHIAATWSSWASGAPEFEMRYREVFI